VAKNAKERASIRNKVLENFNPNENGLVADGIFGLPFSCEESELILFPVPWEVTVSYRDGTAQGPKAILDASQQLDLFYAPNPSLYTKGIAMHPISDLWLSESQKWRNATNMYLNEYGTQDEMSAQSIQTLKAVNQITQRLTDYVAEQTNRLLAEDRCVGLIGGDHSTPLGFIQTLAEKHSDFGILQIDAHADLRDAYEGFVHSHASIMYNALKLSQVSKLVQVGIRDISLVEVDYISKNTDRIACYFDQDLKERHFGGDSWSTIVDEMISKLPEKVYISFDIDGLEPNLCPNTGTPVPGGLSYSEVVYLIRRLKFHNKQIIGFDLVEVAPGVDEWDGNVGARILFELSMIILDCKKEL
jgi:agmatinase